MKRRVKIGLSALGVAGILAVAAAFAALHYGSLALKSKVEAALGPNSEVGEIAVTWGAVEVRGVILHAPANWPAKDALRAERIVVVPDLSALFMRHLRVKSITVEGAYLSLWRTREGKMRLVPSLIEHPAGHAEAAAATQAPAVEIDDVELRDSVIEFFDGSVTPANHKIRLEKLHASAGPVQVPGFAGRTSLQLAGTIKGAQSDGSFTLEGWLELAGKNSEISTAMRKVDLIPFQPYLLKAADASVKSGLLDLDVKAGVKRNQLHAPGKVTISHLELGDGGGAFSTFMGMPRAAVLSAMKDKEGRISVPFTLQGDLDDPQFSLNAGFARQIGQSIAQGLGISLEGLVRGVTEPGANLGSALKKLLGR